MSFEARKKISVPCEKLLHNKAVKKRRSKMFSNQDSNNSFDENPNEINNEAHYNELKEKYGEIRGNIFEDVNSQSLWGNNEGNNTAGYDNPILTSLLNELEKDTSETSIAGIPIAKTQPITSNWSLRTKGKRMDYSQRFPNNSSTESMHWEKFQSKRSQI